MTSTSQPSKLEPWVFPPETTILRDEDYVDLEVIDISRFPLMADLKGGNLSAEESQVRQDIAARVVRALSKTGFLALKTHGLSHEEFNRQFDLGKLLIDEVSVDEKNALAARINEEQSWAGYKQQGFHERTSGAWDALEHFDFYPFTARVSRLPEAAQPYLDDFRNFIEFNHYTLLRKVLAMISTGLGLDEESLWKLHHVGDPNDHLLQCGPDDEIHWPNSKDHLRYAMYSPLTEEDRVKTNYLWMIPHTDRGSVSFLYSQSVAGLQVLVGDEWKYVRHYPDHIIVDTGDCLSFLTGGIIKAPPHRVREPPEDQRHFRRLGIFYFVPFLLDTPLEPIDHPALRALGSKDVFEEYRRLGGEPITVNDWLRLRTRLIGMKREKREKRGPMDVLEDIHYAFTNQASTSVSGATY